MLPIDNPMGRVLMATLIFEAITVGLAIPVMIMVEHVGAPLAAISGGVVAVLCVLAAGTMRRPRLGYPLGWLSQAAALALGLLTTGMLAMGGLFTALWVVCFVLGRRLEAQRAG